MKVVKKRIPSAFYRKIHQVLPILTIDLVIKHRNSFLLVKRKNNPCANIWYFPGGRLLKGEKVIEAAARKLKEETGLTGRGWKFLGFHEHFYNPKRSYFPGFASHVISLVFRVECDAQKRIVLDSQGSDYKWFLRIGKGFDSYHRKFLRLSGFK